MSIDTFSTYFPTTLDNLDLVRYHQNLRLWVAANSTEEVDTHPGSVVGDLIVGSSSIINAGLDAALTNFTSDLDLANPASGKIYNCEFVSKYLENFSTSNYTDITSSGVIRLVFTTPTFKQVDRSIQFRSGTQIFMPRVYKEGAIRILPPGQKRDPNRNDVVLTGINNRFYVDISVYSMDESTVENLDTFELSELIPDIVEAYAVGTFWTRAQTNSIQDLANKTRVTAVSANSTNRSGLVRLVRQEFPEVTAVSPVISSDVEMARQSVNPLGLPEPKVDLYVKTALYGSALKEPIRLDYDVTTNSYFGEVIFTETPLAIDAVFFADIEDQNLEFKSYFYSTNSKMPKLSAAGSSNFRVWLHVTPKIMANGAPLLPPLRDTATNQLYQVFEVTYRADPGIKIIEDFFSSPDTKPIGVDLVVKSFVPIDFTALYINHSRKRGVRLDQSKASSEILTYLQNVSWPESYSDASIIDSMFYSGASNVFKIESDAVLRLCPCTHVLNEVPSTVSALESISQEVPTFIITGSNNFAISVSDTNPDFEENMHYATGPRNISFLLDRSSILFREVGNNVL
jgi:hypothetical protein